MLSMGQKRDKLSNQVRRAVEDSGVSRYSICKAAGIDQGQFSRFMAGTMGLSMTALDALADVLKLRIVVDGPAKVLPAETPGRKPKAKGKVQA
jgi:transcriptional regulator with XRE-family HTH domain